MSDRDEEAPRPKKNASGGGGRDTQPVEQRAGDPPRKAAKPSAKKDVEPDPPDAPEDDKPMTFWEHLEDLRTRIVRSAIFFLIGFGLAYWKKEDLLEFISIPYCAAWKREAVEGTCALTFAAPHAAFMSYAKLSAIVGIAGAAPVISYQLWGFIAPGLYAREKRYIYPFAFASTALFIGGALLAYFVVFPLSFDFFLGMSGNHGDGSLTINPMITMENYISFATQMVLGFGLIFEIPIVLSFLALVGIVNHKMLIKFARYYILIAFIVAAIITPPDVQSQLIMAIPACLLYGISIGLVWLLQKKPPPGYES